MYFITYVVMPIVGGILAASGFIIAKKPDAKELIDKIAPYKGFVGVGMLATGVLNLLDFFDVMGVLNIIGKVLFILILVSQFGIGILLGFGLIGKYMGGAAEKGAEFQKKLITVEVPLGFVAIVAGVAMLLVRLNILKIFG